MRELVFSSKHCPHMVLLSLDAMTHFCNYRQFSGPESGGLMLGYWRDPHVEVIKCTGPMKKDKQSRFSFLRKDKRHLHTAQAIHLSTGAKVCYLGEWHSHPEDYPSPSNIDLSEWNKIQTNYERPLLFVIVGRKGLYVQLGRFSLESVK